MYFHVGLSNKPGSPHSLYIKIHIRDTFNIFLRYNKNISQSFDILDVSFAL